LARFFRNDLGRRRAYLQLGRRSAWRGALLSLHRQARGRQDVGRARHGRVYGREVDRDAAHLRPAGRRRRMKLAALFMIGGLCAHGQFVLTKEQMIAYTSENPYDRFPDGRPKVPDALLEKVKGLVVEEVYGPVKSKGFPNQFAGDWKILQPG